MEVSIAQKLPPPATGWLPPHRPRCPEPLPQVGATASRRIFGVFQSERLLFPSNGNGFACFVPKSNAEALFDTASVVIRDEENS